MIQIGGYSFLLSKTIPEYSLSFNGAILSLVHEDLVFVR